MWTKDSFNEMWDREVEKITGGRLRRQISNLFN